jgi:protein TonB
MKSFSSRLFVSLIFLCHFGLDAHAQSRNGIVITKDDNGVIREKGQMEKGRRQGQWSFYDSKGQLEQQTTYAGGKKHGTEVHFFRGDTVSLGHYTNDVQTGEWKKWDNNAHLIKLEHYDEEGNETGAAFQWESDGSLKEYSIVLPDKRKTVYEYNHGRIERISNYKELLLDGKMTIYNQQLKSPNDSIRETREYANGKQHGISIVYSKGIMVSKDSFCNDLLCDSAILYDENGRVKLSRMYVNGRLEGVERKYENGKLAAETNYVNGAQSGKQILLNASGILVTEAYFTAGRLDSSFSYYENPAHTLKEKIICGPEFSQPLYKDTVYYENGNLKTTFSWKTARYYFHGAHTTYYPNGKAKTLITYKDPIGGVATEGMYKEWNSNGILVLQAYCTKDELKDTIRAWKDDGTELNEKSVDFDRTVYRLMQVGMSFHSSIPQTENVPKDIPNGLAKVEYFKTDSLTTFENAAVYSFAEVMPDYPDGFMAYLSKNIKYPVLEKEMGKQGTVYVSFIITYKGTVSNVKCVKEVEGAPGLSKESMRVIRSMPKWTPGMQNGKPVNVRMIQPVRFKLQ